MGQRLRVIREKLRIPSWPILIHLVIAEVILNSIWNWVSKMFEIVWIREIGFLVVFVGAIFAVAWYLPKLAPELYSFGIMRRTHPPTTRPRLEHDGVLWEDNGTNVWGNLDVVGPLCPKDYTPLAGKRRDEVDTNVRDDIPISDSGYHWKLFCSECENEYTLGVTPKYIQQSRGEVSSRFEGMRRRSQDG